MYGTAIGTAIASNGDKQCIDNMAVTKFADKQPTRECSFSDVRHKVEAALHDELQRVRREVRLVQALQKEQQQRRRDAIAAMQSLQTSRAATALSATGGPEASQVTIATANGVVPSVDAVGNRSNSGDNTADSSPRRSDPHSGHDKSPGIPRVTAGSTSAGAISSVGGLPSNTGSAGKPPPYDGPPALLVVPQTAQADGAFCLDSTPAGYYFRPGVGKNASKSKRLDKTYKHGFCSPDPVTNPDFHDWTHVFFIYCDGSSFTSNQEKPIYRPAPLWNNTMVSLYFRGHRVLQTTLKDLFLHRRLGEATEVLLAGHSAGAMAVLIHADAIRARFAASTRFVAVVDAGLFVPYCNITVYARSHCQFMQQAVDWWNVTGLPTECLAGEPEAWHCLFPGYLLNYIKTPLFMVQHLYDNWAVKNLLGMKWLSYNNRAERNQLRLIANYGKELAHYAQPQMHSQSGGLYLSKCQLGVHGELLMHHWGQHRIQGATPQYALHAWYTGQCRDSNRCQWSEECDWPELYGHNMTLVAEGKLDACLLQAGRWEVGNVQQFRAVGQCPANAKFVLQRVGKEFVWQPVSPKSPSGQLHA